MLFFFTPFALFFLANRKNYYQLNPHIFFENMEFAKIITRKKQSKHHSQKFVPAKIYTNKIHEKHVQSEPSHFLTLVLNLLRLSFNSLGIVFQRRLSLKTNLARNPCFRSIGF